MAAGEITESGAALCPLSPRPVPAALQVGPAAMADGEGDPGVFTATALPGDPRLLPTVTSAFLGTRVFRAILHAAGVYSGAAGDTHRADVPSPLGLRMAAPAARSPAESFTLNTWTGEQGARAFPGDLPEVPFSLLLLPFLLSRIFLLLVVRSPRGTVPLEQAENSPFVWE